MPLEPTANRQERKRTGAAPLPQPDVSAHRKPPYASISCQSLVIPPVRPRPEHKRVWASLAQSPREVIGEMFDEAARSDPRRHKRWVALVDGNLPQIHHLEQLAQERGVPLVIVVDFIHVAQYVWNAAGALFPAGSWNKIAGRDTTCSRFSAGRPAWSRRACAAAPRCARWRRRSAKSVAECAGICSTIRRTCSSTWRWPRGFPSPLGSLKAHVVIWSRTG